MSRATAEFDQMTNGHEKDLNAINAINAVSKELPLASEATDYANARRLVESRGESLRYCFAWRRWLVWYGKRWSPDETGAVWRFAKETARAIYQEAADAVDDASAQALGKWARTSLSEARIKAMVELAKSEPGVPVTPDELDRDPWLLNCENALPLWRGARVPRPPDVLAHLRRAALSAPDREAAERGRGGEVSSGAPLQRAREFLSRGFAGDEPEPKRRIPTQAKRNIPEQPYRNTSQRSSEPSGSDEAARIASRMSPDGKTIIEEIDVRLAQGGEAAEDLPTRLPGDLLDRAGRLDPKDQRRLARIIGLRVREQSMQDLMRRRQA